MTNHQESTAEPSPGDSTGWKVARVSRHSCAGDELWQFDPRTPNRRQSLQRITWRLDVDSTLSFEERSALVDVGKKFLWLMMTAPPPGRRRWSHGTAVSAGHQVLRILKWMFTESIPSFRKLDAAAMSRFRATVSTRPGRHRERASAQTIHLYVDIFAALYQLRHQLSDAPLIHPNPGAAERQLAPRSQQDKRPIPPIPDGIAIPFLNAALHWVERGSKGILGMWELAHGCPDDDPGNQVGQAHSFFHRLLIAEPLFAPDGKRIYRVVDLQRAIQQLRVACAIVIGGFVGMRISEILALRRGAIETTYEDATNIPRSYLVSRLFKTSDARDGRETRWIAPAPAIHAVRVLERITAPLHDQSGSESLFISLHAAKHYVTFAADEVNEHINHFAKALDLPLHEGRRWVFSTHQLRKTFARLVVSI